MKVNIGTYQRSWTNYSYQNYMIKKYGVLECPSMSKHTRYETFLYHYENFMCFIYRNTINKIFVKIPRKIKVKIEQHDLWSADHTLALVILPLLRQFRENAHSAPNVDNEDVPKELRMSAADKKKYNKNGHTDDKFFDRWNYVIDEMIHSFECIVDDDWEDQFHSGNIDFDWVPLDSDNNEVEEKDATRFEIKKGSSNTHSFDKEGWIKANDRINNGLRLFGKYYRSLWT